MFKFVFLLPIPFLIGYAAALVPESNNPRTKINQASQLFNEMGRPVGAVTLLKQAIPLAQKQNDKESEADAEFYLAEIYKSPGPNSSNLQNPQIAIDHFQRAKILYDELKFYKKSAFVSWNESAAYGLVNDKKKEMPSLTRSRKNEQKMGN